jgi:hypothetical protein
MASQKSDRIRTRLVRIVFVALFASLVATGSPVLAEDTLAGCTGGCP